MRAIRVHVQNRRREAGGGARSRDRAEDFGKPAAVIERPVGKEDKLDRREVHAKAHGVGQPYVAVGTDVEQCRSRGRASAGRDEHGKPMAGQA